MKRFVLILCLMLPSWGWADNYLCIAEQAAGFKTIDGRHQATEFKTEDKYLVSEATGNVTRFGKKSAAVYSMQTYDTLHNMRWERTVHFEQG